jgi:hypothetical protein
MVTNFVELICTCCDFYKESDEELECGAFRILKILVERGLVSPRDIESAKNEVIKGQR